MVNQWSLLLQEFDIEFEWVSSEMNVSDCLSRLGADDLFLQHDKVEDDFPPFPKSDAGIDAGVQVNTGKVCAIQTISRHEQQ